MSDESPLPSNCKYVEMGHKSITVSVTGDEDWLDEAQFEDVEMEEYPWPQMDKKKILFEKGDYIPLEVAERCWEGLNDRVICKDGNHNFISQGRNVPFEQDESIYH